MGWEAIEQYLIEVEREVKNLDQQVPQMIVDGQEVMQQTTDFYTEEFMHNKPIPVFDAVEQTVHFEETSDLCDLDREDSTFYPHQENFTNFATKPEPAQLSNFGSYIDNNDTGYIKTEPVSEYPEYSVNPDCAVPDCISNYCYSYSDSMEERYRTMKSQVFDLCTQDVLETCKCLNISPDPYQWSQENVQHWIVWQCRQYGEKQPNLDHFYITGSELCSLTENEFKIFAPESCSMLSSRLSIWKSVVEQMTSKTYQPVTPSPVSFIPVPRSPCLPSSPDSVSSNPAMLSDTESQPSSPPCSSSDDNERLPNEPVNHHRQTIQLWQFLKLLLLDGGYTDCIRWVDRSRGIFKIENSSKVAKLWGRRKNRPAMNYDKLSRSIRQYYKKNIIKKTEHSKRLVYQFCHM